MHDQLTIDSLVARLTALRQEVGDIPVILRDADTCWAFKLTEAHVAPEICAKQGVRLRIMANYGDEMEHAGAC